MAGVRTLGTLVTTSAVTTSAGRSYLALSLRTAGASQAKKAGLLVLAAMAGADSPNNSFGFSEGR